VFHILIYCLTTGKSGAENSALFIETCEAVSLSQASRIISGTINFQSNLGIAHAWLFNSSSTPSGSANTYNEMDTGMGMNPSPISWKNSLPVNNVSCAGQNQLT
jgi:hypothetical protein